MLYYRARLLRQKGVLRPTGRRFLSPVGLDASGETVCGYADCLSRLGLVCLSTKDCRWICWAVGLKAIRWSVIVSGTAPLGACVDAGLSSHQFVSPCPPLTGAWPSRRGSSLPWRAIRQWLSAVALRTRVHSKDTPCSPPNTNGSRACGPKTS